MASKYAMLSTANYYAGIVASAKSSCEKAAQGLISPYSEVESTWQGSSGSAMAAALDGARVELNRIYAQLASIEGQMRAHAQGIYNGWPEEKPKKDEET